MLQEPNQNSSHQGEKIQGPRRDFDIGAILTISTGLLLTNSEAPNGNGFDKVYEVLDWMMSERPGTHQVGRFLEEAIPWLCRWYPQLERVSQLTEQLTEALAMAAPGDSPTRTLVINEWVEEISRKFGLGPTLSIGKIPADDHVRKDPFEELVIIRGTDEDIIRAT